MSSVVVAMKHAHASTGLTPRQNKACKEILTAVERCGGQVLLRVDSGFGRTAILRNLRESLPAGAAALVETGKLMKTLMFRQAMPIEESFLELCLAQLAQAKLLLLIDDLHLLMRVTDGSNYPRPNMLDVAISALMDEAAARNIGIVFGLEQDIPLPLATRAHRVELRSFAADDYRAICAKYLDAELDERRVHHFAPKLNGWQLRNACLWMRQEADVNTDAFIEHLQSRNLASNVEIQEVEAISWSDLKGMDDLVLELEAKIALPLENDAIATAMQLRPKRGVLLAGPPGTGKTTIGKALAHRLKSKFFLLDGTFVADGGNFFDKAEALFEAAKNNAPSILFIDDADVIFDEKSNRGFYRYLLTLLDGLEGGGESGRVCVMMTAMDPSALPPALLRSGRVELWLETRMPNEGARRDIVAERLRGLPEPIASGVDPARIAQASRGFTGADLKSVVEDGKLLYAYDQSCGAVRQSVEAYFLNAIAKIRAKRRGLSRTARDHSEEGRFGFAG